MPRPPNAAIEAMTTVNRGVTRAVGSMAAAALSAVTISTANSPSVTGWGRASARLTTSTRTAKAVAQLAIQSVRAQRGVAGACPVPARSLSLNPPALFVQLSWGETIGASLCLDHHLMLNP